MIRAWMLLTVILIGCSRTVPIPPVPPVPQPSPSPLPISPPSSGMANFWYSQSQYDNLKILHDMNPNRFNLDQLKLNGKQYTECNHNSAPIGRFVDYVLVGTGPADTCTKSSGEWE